MWLCLSGDSRQASATLSVGVTLCELACAYWRLYSGPMHYRKVQPLDFKNKTKRDVSIYLFMYQFVSISNFFYFLRMCVSAGAFINARGQLLILYSFRSVLWSSNSVLPRQRRTSSLTLCTCMCGWVGCARTHVCIHTPVQAGCGYYFLGDLSPYAWGGSLPLEPKAGRFSLLWRFPDYSLNTETTSNQGT